MFRAITLLAGITVFLAPTVLAQNSTLCVFQQKQGHSADVDAGFDSSALTKELTAAIPSGLALTVAPVTGFTKDEIAAEAQRRSCSWVVVLWREQMNAASPNYEGTLGGTQMSDAKGVDLMVKGAKIGGDTILQYSLRKPDSHKNLAYGEGEDESTYAKFAKAIVKKIEKEK